MLLQVLNPDIVTLTRPPNHRLFDHSRGVKPDYLQGRDIKPKLKGETKDGIMVDDIKPFPPAASSSFKQPSPSVIDISSDSDSAFSIKFDELKSESLLLRASELMDYFPDRTQTLVQLLYHLDEIFPVHEFLAYQPFFEEADINYRHQLSQYCVDWLVEHIGMPESSAMILFGLAMSGFAGHTAPDQVDSKGKGKALG